MVSQLRRLRGTAKKPSSASAVPPAAGQKRLLGVAMLLVAAVVYMVSVACCAVVPLIVTEVGIEQDGMSLGLEMLVDTRQLRLMEPVKPLLGVRVMVAVPVAPGVTVTVPLLEAAKLGVLTFTAMAVVMVMLPDVPVTVAV